MLQNTLKMMPISNYSILSLTTVLNSTMLEITDIAANKLTTHMNKNGQGKAVRIALRKGG
jgi:hypothetical protein